MALIRVFAVAIGLVIILPAAAHSAEVFLKPGESITIQPEERTKVRCGDASCDERVKGVETLIENCKANYNASVCADKYLPPFKTKNPECALAVLDLCIESCKVTHNGAYCADKCQ